MPHSNPDNSIEHNTILNELRGKREEDSEGEERETRST